MIGMNSKRRQISILVFGMFFLTMGFSIIMPILPYYSKNMGASAFDLGLLMASYSVMQLIFSPFLGRLSDSIGRKPIFLLGLFGYGFSFLVYGFATQLWMLFAARIVGGILAGGLYPTSLAYIADITDHKDRGRIMGLLGASSGIGMIFGPSISGILSVWGLAVPFFATAVAAFVAGIFAFFSLEESRSVDAHRTMPQRMSLVSPLKTRLWLLFLLTILVTFLLASFQGTFAYYMLGRFGIDETLSPVPVLSETMMLTGPAVVAIMFTVMGIAAVVCQGIILDHMIRVAGEMKTVITGLAITGFSFFGLLASPELISTLFFVSMTGIGTGLVTPCLNALVSRMTGKERQGAMLGLLGSYGSIGRIIGPPLGGFVYDVYFMLPFAISGILSLIGAAAAVVFSDRPRH